MEVLQFGVGLILNKSAVTRIPPILVEFDDMIPLQKHNLIH